jgi:hypothetical protein
VKFSVALHNFKIFIFFQSPPVCITREPKVENEDKTKLFPQYLGLMPNKNEEHWKQTVFDKVI